jgi:hypothetical protein
VRAQLLDAARLDHLLDLVHGLTRVQADPTAAIAGSLHRSFSMVIVPC